MKRIPKKTPRRLKDKRSEADLMRACQQYLQLAENLGDIIHHDRLNAGNIVMGKYVVRMCRPGTPDLMAITKSGTVIWMEVKGPDGKMSTAQKTFKAKIEKTPHHYHHVITSLEQMIDIIKILTY